jgi:NADH dehydrogenase
MTEILVTGATGYIGRHLVARLVAAGETPRCLVRPGGVRQGLPQTGVTFFEGDITQPASLEPALRGAEEVVHLAAVVANVKQQGPVNYRRINDEGTANLVRAAREAGVRHFIHMGGINTVPGTPNSYLRTRYNGEHHVKEGGMPYSILQPSILFGKGAAFFTALADLVKTAPAVPVPGDGRLRFQPIWVEDVATCLLRLLAEDGRNETIPVGGPAQFTYDQLLQLVCKAVGKRRALVHVPLFLVRPGVMVMESVLPRPPLTRAALELFDSGLDNIATLTAVPARFGFQPKSLVDDLAEHGI